MREFNYRITKENRWDSEMLALIAAIYKEVGKKDYISIPYKPKNTAYLQQLK